MRPEANGKLRDVLGRSVAVTSLTATDLTNGDWPHVGERIRAKNALKGRLTTPADEVSAYGWGLFPSAGGV